MPRSASFVHFVMFSAVWRSVSQATRPMSGASGDEGEAEENETVEIEDELKAYLELPQLKCKTEQEAIDWWVEKTKRFPNLSAMARQYLGCPATSATEHGRAPVLTCWDRVFGEAQAFRSGHRSGSDVCKCEFALNHTRCYC